MISPDELEAWAKLYDRGYYSFEPDEQMFAARAKLDRELEARSACRQHQLSRVQAWCNRKVARTAQRTATSTT